MAFVTLLLTSSSPWGSSLPPERICSDLRSATLLMITLDPALLFLGWLRGGHSRVTAWEALIHSGHCSYAFILSWAISFDFPFGAGPDSENCSIIWLNISCLLDSRSLRCYGINSQAIYCPSSAASLWAALRCWIFGVVRSLLVGHSGLSSCYPSLHPNYPLKTLTYLD